MLVFDRLFDAFLLEVPELLPIQQLSLDGHSLARIFEEFFLKLFLVDFVPWCQLPRFRQPDSVKAFSSHLAQNFPRVLVADGRVDWFDAAP